MRALLLVLTLVPQAARAATPDSTWQVEEVRFTAPDGVELVGSLYVPEGEGPLPAAVIIQGSGASDRGNLWARTVARTLARAGVVTLLPDKRGSGESGGDWMAASFEVLARDALAALDRIAAHPRVGAVGIVGLSQGGHVAPLAAALDERVAWVVDVSGAAVTMVEQIRHEMANTAREAGLSEVGVEAVVEIQRRAERHLETGEWAPYFHALEAAVGTEWAEIAGGFPQSPDSPVWAWARLNGAYDPIPHWKALDIPVFVAYGEEDESDNVPVAESVRRLEAAIAESGHTDATVRVYPGTGHALWAPDATHEDLRLHPDLVEELTAWIHSRGGASRPRAWTPESSSSADSLVAARIEADRIPGAALVVVEDGAIVHLEGYGLADRDRGIPVDPERTLFRIGSVTKALTALALVALVEDEGIDLDAPIETLLAPGLVPVGSGGQPIRIHHLLTHSAGFDQTGLGRRVDDPTDRPSLEAFLREHLVRVRPPGAVGVYDTYGMTLAGHLIERIAGTSYAEHMRSRVFQPLGMDHTWVEAPDSARAELATGYGLEDDEWVPQAYEWYVTTPASSVDATVADMGRLVAALLGDGGALLSPELAARVRSEIQLAYDSHLPAFSWGFWEARRGGRRVLHHGGTMAGYTSELHLVPEAGIGFFVAYDRDLETGPPTRLREDLADFLHARVLPARPAPGEPPPHRPVPTERFAGAYGGTVGCFTCSEGEGWGINAFQVTALERGAISIFDRRRTAIDSTGFRREDDGARIRFLTDSEGRVRYLVSGPDSFARLDEVLLDEVLGELWREAPPAPLVATVLRANERWAEAADAYASLAARHPDNGAYAFYEGFTALNAGAPARAIAAFERARALGKWPAWSRYYVAASHAASGDAGRALDGLALAIDEGFSDPHLLASEPWWGALRDDPRFQELAARLD